MTAPSGAKIFSDPHQRSWSRRGSRPHSLAAAWLKSVMRRVDLVPRGRLKQALGRRQSLDQSMHGRFRRRRHGLGTHATGRLPGAAAGCLRSGPAGNQGRRAVGGYDQRPLQVGSRRHGAAKPAQQRQKLGTFPVFGKKGVRACRQAPAAKALGIMGGVNDHMARKAPPPDFPQHFEAVTLPQFEIEHDGARALPLEFGQALFRRRSDPGQLQLRFGAQQPRQVFLHDRSILD